MDTIKILNYQGNKSSLMPFISKHLKKYIGHEINIKLFKKDKNGNKEYQGILKAFDQENIELEENIKIERKNIAQIKTVYNW